MKTWKTSQPSTFDHILIAGREELIKEIYCEVCPSKLMYHTLKDFEEISVRHLLRKAKNFPANSLCCYVCDISIIVGTKLVRKADDFTSEIVRVLNTDPLNSFQDLSEFKTRISNQIKVIEKSAASLSEFLPVIILPLVPKIIYCNVDLQAPNIDKCLPYVLNGSRSLWRGAIRHLICTWNALVTNMNTKYFNLDCISSYLAKKRSIYPILDSFSSDFELSLITNTSWNSLATDALSLQVSIRPKNLDQPSSDVPNFSSSTNIKKEMVICPSESEVVQVNGGEENVSNTKCCLMESSINITPSSGSQFSESRSRKLNIDHKDSGACKSKTSFSKRNRSQSRSLYPERKSKAAKLTPDKEMSPSWSGKSKGLSTSKTSYSLPTPSSKSETNPIPSITTSKTRSKTSYLLPTPNRKSETNPTPFIITSKTRSKKSSLLSTPTSKSETNPTPFITTSKTRPKKSSLLPTHTSKSETNPTLFITTSKIRLKKSPLLPTPTRKSETNPTPFITTSKTRLKKSYLLPTPTSKSETDPTPYIKASKTRRKPLTSFGIDNRSSSKPLTQISSSNQNSQLYASKNVDIKSKRYGNRTWHSGCERKSLTTVNYFHERLIMSETSHTYNELRTRKPPISNQENFEFREGTQIEPKDINNITKSLQLLKDYNQQLDKLQAAFEKNYSIYKGSPELYPGYELFYQGFVRMYNDQYKNRDRTHMNKTWKLFWESKFDAIKSEDWKRKRQDFINESSLPLQ